jgi:cell division protease FtsH
MDLKRYFRGPFLGILVTLFVVVLVFEYASGGSSYKTVPTSKVVWAVEHGEVSSAQLLDKDNTVQITTTSGAKYQTSWVGNQGQVLQADLQKLYDRGKLPGGYVVQGAGGSAWLTLIEDLFPWVLVILFFLLIMNQMQGGGSRVMNFGKSKAKLITKDTPKTTFADVAGADEPIEELQEIKEFLQNPAKFQAIGAKIPKGVLLYGPPGTGKTLLARAVAGSAVSEPSMALA